jgi:hypothetical protein
VSWSASINLLGLVVLIVGILLLIWSLYHKNVSTLGLALLIAGFVLQILAAFVD